jgi:hypothetical protein
MMMKVDEIQNGHVWGHDHYHDCCDHGPNLCCVLVKEAVGLDGKKNDDGRYFDALLLERSQ